MNTVKSDNHENFLGNEGRNVKQQNFFTANKKQYTVCKYNNKTSYKENHKYSEYLDKQI